jgi:hypothetical protein
VGLEVAGKPCCQRGRMRVELPGQCSAILTSLRAPLHLVQGGFSGVPSVTACQPTCHWTLNLWSASAVT